MKKEGIFIFIFTLTLAIFLVNFANAQTMGEALAGRILLQVEQAGEMWYVNPDDNKKIYIKNEISMLEVMKEFSLGISMVS